MRAWMCAWWRHQMKTFSASLALCTGNSPVTGEFPSQSPVTRIFDVFSDLCLNKRLSKQFWGWWFETPSGSLWRHCNCLSLPGSTGRSMPCWRSTLSLEPSLVLLPSSNNVSFSAVPLSSNVTFSGVSVVIKSRGLWDDVTCGRLLLWPLDGVASAVVLTPLEMLVFEFPLKLRDIMTASVTLMIWPPRLEFIAAVGKNIIVRENSNSVAIEIFKSNDDYIADMAPVLLKTIRSKLEFYEIYHCSSLKKTHPITKKCSTFQESRAVLECAKFICDQTDVREYINKTI